MIIQDLVLTHQDVTLKTLVPEALPAMKAVAADAKIWEYTTTPLSSADEFEQRWFNKAMAQFQTGKRWPFVVECRGQIAGSTSFYEMDDEHRHLAIGYTWYTPQYWGTALNPTVKFLLLRYAFETLHCIRVCFYVDEANLRSCKAMTKIGAVQEGLLRNHMIRANGTYRNTVVFAITDEDWPKVKEGLRTAVSKIIT